MITISCDFACVLLHGQCSGSIGLIAATLYFVTGIHIVCEFKVCPAASIVVSHSVLFLGVKIGFYPSSPCPNNLTLFDAREADANNGILWSGLCCACIYIRKENRRRRLRPKNESRSPPPSTGLTTTPPSTSTSTLSYGSTVFSVGKHVFSFV